MVKQQKILSFFGKSNEDNDKQLFTTINKKVQSKITIAKGQARILHKGETLHPEARYAFLDATGSNSEQSGNSTYDYDDVVPDTPTDEDKCAGKKKFLGRSFLRPVSISSTHTSKPQNASKKGTTHKKPVSKSSTNFNSTSTTQKTCSNIEFASWNTCNSATSSIAPDTEEKSDNVDFKESKKSYVSSSKSLSQWKQMNKRKRHGKDQLPDAKRINIIDDGDMVDVDVIKGDILREGEIEEDLEETQLETDDVLAEVMCELKKDTRNAKIAKDNRASRLSLSKKNGGKSRIKLVEDKASGISGDDVIKQDKEDPDKIFKEILSELNSDQSKANTESQFKGSCNKVSIKNGDTTKIICDNNVTNMNKKCDTYTTYQPQAVVPKQENGAERKGNMSVSFGGDDSWMEGLDLDNIGTSPMKWSQASASVGVLPLNHSYGRHKVIDISVGSNGDKTLTLSSKTEDKTRTCILQGFWSDSIVMPEDTVNILAEFDDTGTCYITDKKGMIVINPDVLISGTSVVSGLYCMRRAVLSEKFKGLEGGNIYMLQGSIIHTFFQKVVQDGIQDQQHILATLDEILQENRVLHDMYGINVNEETIKQEAIKFIPFLNNWIKQYLQLPRSTHQSSSDGLKVTAVTDIEENIWSPRYGIKGKIDLTVKIHDNGMNKSKVVPLELKTGKASYSIEHKGQVTMYSMMMSDRRPDPACGLLLYLKNGSMKSIPADHSNISGLLQQRNELAHYLVHTRDPSVLDDLETSINLKPLPKPINSERSCSQCPQLMNCAIYQKNIENTTVPQEHAMNRLVPKTLAHLEDSHLKYFAHWCNLIHIEMATSLQRKSTKGIWCKTADDREKKGECLSDMVLVGDVKHTPSGSGQCLHTFRKYTNSAKPKIKCLTVRDGVVLSCPVLHHIAIATGTIQRINEDSVTILLDRDIHRQKEYEDVAFRIDKADIYNSMTTVFNNTSRLMANTPHCDKLRKLIIDGCKPEFLHTMSKTTLQQVRPIFKPLNKPQKTAILKVLMSKDYLLIKGYPGTGKTSTIVVLVTVLHRLGYSVLLTSYTHSAVDNILLKLKQMEVDFIRLGRKDRIHAEILPYSAELLTEHLTTVDELKEFYEDKQVVATTCLGTNHVLFQQKRFDICIVDEASQVLLPACLGPLFCADRFVLVGDPKQLPPVVQSKDARSLGMDESLFSRLDDRGATYELTMQYRMNREIMELSNKTVYNGALVVGSQKVAHATLTVTNMAYTKQVPSNSMWLHDVLNTEEGHSVKFLETDKVPALETYDEQKLVRNDTEAKLVALIISFLIQAGVAASEIGVISPYRNQVRVIRDAIMCLPNSEQLEVNTVDQYQGRDKSVIIVSFVRSQVDSQGNVGELLKDWRRLNVAVTRAKHKLILVGNMNTLRNYEPVQKIIDVLVEPQIVKLPPNAHETKLEGESSSS